MEKIHPDVGLLVDREQETRSEAFVFQAFPEVLDYIRSGDIHSLRRFLQTDQRDYYMGAIRDEALIPTLLSYICGSFLILAIEGGLPVARGIALSTLFLEKSRVAAGIDGFLDTVTEMELTFTEEVHHHKRCQSGHRAVDQCMAYIYDHLNEHIQVAELAKLCGYSASRLQHLFRRYTGRSISDCIRREKIQRACLLLKHTEESYLSIAQKLAYGSQSFFIQQFKRETGLTPAQYRSQNQ